MSRRVPTATKRLRGTLRRDRTNPWEPRPTLGAPPCRRGLPAAVRRWYRLVVAVLNPMRVATSADGVALELVAFALAEHEAAAGVILADGATYEARTEGGTIMHRARPEQAIAADAWRRAASMLIQFGLTPASRGKLEARPALDPEDGAVAAGDDALVRLRAARRHIRSGVGGDR